MRILIYIFLLLLPFGFISCKPGGALTPREAYNQLRYAYNSGDKEILHKLITKKSIEKIEGVCKLFSKMEEKQLSGLSKAYNMTPEQLKGTDGQRLSEYPFYIR